MLLAISGWTSFRKYCNYSITHFSSKILVATVQMLHSTVTQCSSFTISSLHGHLEYVFGRWLEFHFCPCCCRSWAIAAGPGAVVAPWHAGPAGPSHCRGQHRAWWPHAWPSGPCGQARHYPTRFLPNSSLLRAHSSVFAQQCANLLRARFSRSSAFILCALGAQHWALTTLISSEVGIKTKPDTVSTVSFWLNISKITTRSLNLVGALKHCYITPPRAFLLDKTGGAKHGGSTTFHFSVQLKVVTLTFCFVLWAKWTVCPLFSETVPLSLIKFKCMPQLLS